MWSQWSWTLWIILYGTMYLSYLKWHDMTSIQDCNPEAVLQQRRPLRRPFSTGGQGHFTCELCVGRSSTTFRTVDGLLQHKPVCQSTIVYTAVMILDRQQDKNLKQDWTTWHVSSKSEHCVQDIWYVIYTVYIHIYIYTVDNQLWSHRKINCNLSRSCRFLNICCILSNTFNTISSLVCLTCQVFPREDPRATGERLVGTSMATFLSPDSGYSLPQPQPATKPRDWFWMGCRLQVLPFSLPFFLLKKKRGCGSYPQKSRRWNPGATAEDVLEALGPSPLKKKAAHGTHWVRRTWVVSWQFVGLLNSLEGFQHLAWKFLWRVMGCLMFVKEVSLGQ